MKVYLDNAATSWPKPPGVVEAITKYLNEYGGSPGRSGHDFAIQAAREVFETREILAGLYHVPDSENVIISANATHALNFAIKGLLEKGDHVIISHMEHNSVLRPLTYLHDEGLVRFDIARCDEKGYVDLEHMRSLILPETKMIICIHGSNVAGTIQPIAKIGALCKENGILFLVDAAQTSGFVPIDMQKENIDILAFTGHKKLYGPPGIGGLCMQKNISIKTLIHGGTGSKSDMAHHPEFYPDRLEAGTINTVGVTGLKAGIQYIQHKGIDSIRQNLSELTAHFMRELAKMEEVTIYGPEVHEERLPLISVNVKNKVPSDLAAKLDKEYGIMVRPGIHCSPLAHKSIGSFPQGTLRFSLGCFTTPEEVEYAIQSLKKIIDHENR
ncbi:MAG: cysteine desulfurase [Bacteroidetes bacterium HGW-Bacteroidetes-21]|jgi:cysteine desulfurase family protein|nr:MAG: cysteine desulfurase [Bacteroidetes bacterium HGW-Bacteroidetes-21]